MDDLGDRMKAYEANHSPTFGPGGFLVVRVDGRAFHSYTRRLDKPFDLTLAADLDHAALTLAGEFSGAVCAYVQSDEISVVATDATSENAQWWFGGKLAKLCSLSASLVTATFNARRDPQGGLATFDARAFVVPSALEVHNYLVWRQADARRNAVSMVAEHLFASKRLHGVPTGTRRQMIADAGSPLEMFDPGQVSGRLICRETYEAGAGTFTRRDGTTGIAPPATRSRWVVDAAPRFTERRELVRDLIVERTGDRDAAPAA